MIEVMTEVVIAVMIEVMIGEAPLQRRTIGVETEEIAKGANREARSEADREIKKGHQIAKGADRRTARKVVQRIGRGASPKIGKGASQKIARRVAPRIARRALQKIAKRVRPKIAKRAGQKPKIGSEADPKTKAKKRRADQGQMNRRRRLKVMNQVQSLPEVTFLARALGKSDQVPFCGAHSNCIQVVYVDTWLDAIAILVRCSRLTIARNMVLHELL